MSRTHDSKCYDLAVSFLEDQRDLQTYRNCVALAYEIQRCIEDWIGQAKMEQKPQQVGNPCPKCGAERTHYCSWACADVCPNCNSLGAAQ